MGRPLTGARLAVGSPRETPDIRYRLGFCVPDPVVYLERAGRRYLVVALLDREEARAQAPGLRVFLPGELNITRAQRGSLSGWAVGLMRTLNLRAARIAAEFPVRAADALRRAGVRLDVVEGALFPERAVKTPLELRRIAECQRAAVRALKAAVALIAGAREDGCGRLTAGGRPLTSECVRGEIARILLGCTCSGEGTIVAGGRQSANPHGEGRGPLRAHEPIVLDIFPRHLQHGYWGDLTRTVVKGTPPPVLRAQYEAVKAAQAAALAAIRAGVSGRRVHAAAAACLARRGYQTGLLDGRAQGFIHSTGHGLGLAVHEAPSLGLRPGRLRAGNVVTVEPGLYYADRGGVRIEDTVEVTASGCRRLAACPDYFQV